MKNQEFSIEKIHQYIDGELSQQDSLFVERMLAEDEQWRDAYEGLIVANNLDINTTQVTQELAEQLPTHSRKTPIVQLMPDQRWFYAAASIIGIAVVSFGLIYLLNKTTDFGRQTEYSKRSTSDGFYPEDQIQIIPTRPEEVITVQHFDESKINELSKIESSQAFDGPENKNKTSAMDAESNEEFSQQALNKTETQNSTNSNILNKYGYRELSKPSLLNTTRGASQPSPEFYGERITQHALSQDQIKSLKNKYEKDYFARFPFNGLVKTQFLIGPSGQVQDFRVLSTPNKDSAEVVKEFVNEKVNWSAPKNQSGQPTYELINLEVLFGNSIQLSIEFANN